MLEAQHKVVGVAHNDHVASSLATSPAFGPKGRFLITGSALVLAALIALGEVGSWDVAIRFIWQVPYGQSDPLYGKDIGFYLFTLPAYVAIKNWVLLTLILSAIFAGAVYFVQGNLTFDTGLPAFPWVIAHGSALLGLFFAVKAWSYWFRVIQRIHPVTALIASARSSRKFSRASGMDRPRLRINPMAVFRNVAKGRAPALTRQRSSFRVTSRT